jgi:hypothetical protein
MSLRGGMANVYSKRNLWYVFLAVLLLNGCEKKGELPAQIQQETAGVQQLINNPDPASAETPVTPDNRIPIIPLGSVDPIIVQMEKEGKSLQEIIESYEPPFLRGYGIVLAFQIEGNFTGSGNREIIAGYERAGANYRRSGYGIK